MALVWVQLDEDPFQAYVLGEVLESGKVRIQSTGKVIDVDDSWLTTLDHIDSLEGDFEDLVGLDDLSQPLVLHHLEKRFMQDKIYTNVGSIVIAINPYKSLPLYTTQIILEFLSHKSAGTPHVFNIADNAYRSLAKYRTKQSIVISGESGAGKTESTKQCLKYLSECAGSQTSVDKRILMSNPILEAFGNAKTKRNNNSSRFGKYIEIFFDSRFKIAGAMNTNYLLEKIRVTQQSQGERNYHILYQLCLGLDAESRASLGLSGRSAGTFRYLNQSGCMNIDGVDDLEEFKDVLNCFIELGISETEYIFKVVASVLHLGNVDFDDIGDRECCVIESSTEYNPLEWAANLLGVPRDEIVKSLEKTMFSSGRKGSSAMGIGNSAATARLLRDSLARYLYSSLFDWLVNRVNAGIASGQHLASSDFSIGVLDIFGFEMFEHNSFEQLCINYANELLQLLFTTNTLTEQLNLYERENIDYDSVLFEDNKGNVELISQKPSGILYILDEAIRLPNTNDALFMEKLVSTHQGNSLFRKVIKNPKLFKVEHYAANVKYDSSGFVEKSKDKLSPDLSRLLQEVSSCPFISKIVEKDIGVEDQFSRKPKKNSLGVQFVKDVQGLADDLNNTTSHYIRCIKPNENKAPREFNGPMILEQLNNSGVFSVITMRRQGFPFQVPHSEFCGSYRILKPECVSLGPGPELVAAIADQMSVLVQIGLTKVFYRQEQHVILSQARNIAIAGAVIMVQSCARRYIARMKCRLLLEDMFSIAVPLQDIPTMEVVMKASASCGISSHSLDLNRVLYEQLCELIESIDALLDVNVSEHIRQVRKVVFTGKRLGYESKEFNLLNQKLDMFYEQCRDSAAADIQGLYRGYKVRSSLQAVTSSVAIQRVFRGFRVRRLVKRELMRMLRDSWEHRNSQDMLAQIGSWTSLGFPLQPIKTFCQLARDLSALMSRIDDMYNSDVSENVWGYKEVLASATAFEYHSELCSVLESRLKQYQASVVVAAAISIQSCYRGFSTRRMWGRKLVSIFTSARRTNDIPLMEVVHRIITSLQFNPENVSGMEDYLNRVHKLLKRTREVSALSELEEPRAFKSILVEAASLDYTSEDIVDLSNRYNIAIKTLEASQSPQGSRRIHGITRLDASGISEIADLIVPDKSSLKEISSLWDADYSSEELATLLPEISSRLDTLHACEQEVAEVLASLDELQSSLVSPVERFASALKCIPPHRSRMEKFNMMASKFNPWLQLFR